MPAATPFWKRKSLAEVSFAEWESLCDGCARCCLQKLQDEDSGAVLYTNVVCRLLETQSCRCSRYSERARLVKDCVRLSPEGLGALTWMPPTCAYRLLAEGKALPSWHPLISGSLQSVHQAGVSVRGWSVPESEATDLEEHVIHWRL